MIVVAAVIACDGRVLACQRSRHGKFPLKWEFPGGKVHPGETPQAALERELKEELGISAKAGKEIFRVRHKYAEMEEPFELIFFEVSIGSAAIQNSVFERIEWVEAVQLAELDFLEADRDLIRKIAAGEIRVAE